MLLQLGERPGADVVPQYASRVQLRPYYAAAVDERPNTGGTGAGPPYALRMQLRPNCAAAVGRTATTGRTGAGPVYIKSF